MLARMNGRSRPLWSLVLAAAILFPAPHVGAEDSPGRPKAKPPGGFKFSPPEPDPTTTPPANAPPSPSKPSKQPPEPTDPTDAAIRRLATWPGQDGIKAAETLLLMGPDAIDPCLRAVAGNDPAVKPGAAWVLGKVGSSSHVPALCTAAAGRLNGSRIEVFFEAAQELDPVATKRWLFSFLTLDRPVFRARATEFLGGLVTAEDRPQIDRLLHATSRQAGVRVAGLELLARTKMPDATARIIEALSDPHPDVAHRASQILASSEDPEVVKQLNVLVRDGDSRQRGYATLALAEYNRRARKNGFEAASIPALIGRRGLLHPDRLLRVSAAIGLTYGALDSRDPAVGDLLDKDVVSVLIEAAGGDHFLDYGSVIELIFASLRRLSGQDLPSTAKPWAQWWQDNLGSFQARRTLAGVTEDDIPRTRVVFEIVEPDGRRRQTVFSSEGGAKVEGAYVLPLPAFRALVGGLEDAGIFQQGDDQRTLADEHLAARVGILNQEKRMVLSPSRDDARYETLLARVVALEETNLWQRYRDADQFPDATVWWPQQAEIFAAAAPETRRGLLTHMIAASFDDLKDDSARSVALDDLERLGARALTDADAGRLVAWATQSPAYGSIESRTVELVAMLDRPGLAEPLVEALSRSTAPGAAKRLTELLAASGPVRVREGFADPKPAIRSAAALASAQLLSGPMGKDPTTKARLASVLEEGLRALLLDPDPVVRVRAAGSLAMLGDSTMIERLETLFREGKTPSRIAVAEVLGAIGGPSVQPMLVRIVGEVGQDSAPVRAAALQSMAASKNPEAVRILAFYMLNDADTGVQQAAESALTSVASDAAREALTEMLSANTLDVTKKIRVVRALGAFQGGAVRDILGRHLDDDDPKVVDQAALGLAAAREGVAVPYLLAILKRPEEPLRPKALEALQDLTSVSLLVTSYESVADQYESWYRLHSKTNDRAWFRDAVAKKGYDTTGLEAYVRGEADLAAVPVLLKSIRDEDPVIRRNSDLALRRVTGIEDKQHVDRGSSREESQDVANRWASWWSQQPQSKAMAEPKR